MKTESELRFGEFLYVRIELCPTYSMINSPVLRSSISLNAALRAVTETSPWSTAIASFRTLPSPRFLCTESKSGVHLKVFPWVTLWSTISEAGCSGLSDLAVYRDFVHLLSSVGVITHLVSPSFRLFLKGTLMVYKSTRSSHTETSFSMSLTDTNEASARILGSLKESASKAAEQFLPTLGPLITRSTGFLAIWLIPMSAQVAGVPSRRHHSFMLGSLIRSAFGYENGPWKELSDGWSIAE
ncbi:hypothetical protein OGATHE_001204 [Ogataea polymorpha]|uniref:Uncharacterized protein n=1 Tax=Ogataea polymorpha TaxID=460523 RepID=A0A9P8TFI1_9ASCO|nr:hypothetical protein OGATHE_001204 [Ogataea polymorpha]